MPARIDAVENDMALINCAECGREFSDKATQCPQCGAPIDVAANKEPAGQDAMNRAPAMESGATELVSDSEVIINASVEESIRIVANAMNMVGAVERMEAGPSAVCGTVLVGSIGKKVKVRAELIETPDGLSRVDIAIQEGVWSWLPTHNRASNALSFAIANYMNPSVIPKRMGAARLFINRISFVALSLMFAFVIFDFFKNDLPVLRNAVAPAPVDNRSLSSTRQYLSLMDLTGEWVADAFGSLTQAGSVARDHRILVIHGSIKNTSSDSLRKVVCPTAVNVRFTNGRSVVIRSDDICGNTAMLRAGGMSGSALHSMAGLTLRPGEEQDFGESSDSQAILAKFGSGLGLSGEYASYDVASVRIDVEYAGETVFGDRIKGKLAGAQLPHPSESRRFKIN